MKLTNSGGDFKPAPMGLHEAVCVDIVDLGMLPGLKGPQRKLYICFELPYANMDDGRPFIVIRRFTASLAETAHLSQFLAKWRGGIPFKQGEEIDLETLIGKPALVVVTHADKEGKKYANIDSILPCAKPVRPSGHYKRKEPQSGSAVQQPIPQSVRPGPVTPVAGRTAFPFTTPHVPPQTPAGPLPTTAELAPKTATEEQKQKFLTVLAPLQSNAAKYFYALGAIGREQLLEELPLSFCPATKAQFDNVIGSIQAFIDAQQSVTANEDPDIVPF